MIIYEIIANINMREVLENMNYIDKTREEWEELAPDIAVLPLGSFEQHGPHLPLGTDIYIVEALSSGIAEALGAYLLPVQPVSTCYEHHGKRGSFHYSADVFYRMIVCLLEKLYENGFRKITVIPGHGGIFVLEPAVGYIKAKYPDADVIIVSPYDRGDLPGWPFGDDGLHADDMETSLMLRIKPELVDMAKAVDFVPDKPRPYLNYGSIFTICPDGVWGSATRATGEKGAWLLENAVVKTAERIKNYFGKGGR